MTALLDWPPASVRLLSSGPVTPHRTCHVLSQLRAADEKIGQPDVVACRPLPTRPHGWCGARRLVRRRRAPPSPTRTDRGVHVHVSDVTTTEMTFGAGDDGRVVVGLDNPGPAYAPRHNVGYLADELARRMRGRWRTQKSGRAFSVEGRLAGVPGVRAVLGRGRCFMNESGGPVSSLLSFFKATPDQLGTGDFYRMWMGIGRPVGRQDTVGFVLAPFSTAELRELELHVQRAADAVEALGTDGLDAARNHYH